MTGQRIHSFPPLKREDDQPWLFGPGFNRAVKDSGWTCLQNPVASFTLNGDDRDVVSAERVATALRSVKAFAEDIPKGGAIAGYLAYEVAAGLEPSLSFPSSPDGLPLILMRKYEAIQSIPELPIVACDLLQSNIDKTDDPSAYVSKAARVIDHVLAGDIFQANISRRQSAYFNASSRIVAPSIFQRLVGDDPAPYAAFLPFSSGAILSNSPELFLKVDGRTITAEPVKGTRARHPNQQEDAIVAAGLAKDEKERAENIMIADLLRNDLAKVCEDHSILEPVICAVRTLPHVHHLYSRICGRLRKGEGAMDALLAAFPCGSVTGAPKHEAMRIIAKEEKEGRGPYCGTVFYIPHDGAAVFSVPIRTGALYDDGGRARLDVRSGGGVTVLSDPAREYQETVDKAYPFRAMTLAERD